MIELKGIKKSYNTIEALKGIDLIIPEGSFFAYVGANGAGKTTTIKILMGILKPDIGDVFFEKYSILKNTIEIKKKIGYVPDVPILLDGLTGKEYLNFTFEIFECYTDDNKKRIDELIEIFEFRNYLNNQIMTYSLGNKKKLSILSALCHNPSYLILDEPMSGLDPKAIIEFKNILSSFTKNGGTVFLSTHSLDFAEKYCDEVAFLMQGQIIKQGKVKELLSNNISLESLYMKTLVH